MSAKPQVWTHHSVSVLAGNADPVQVITGKARAKAMEAIQSGWSGPPYDPFQLADLLKIPVVARQDISEARTVPSKSGFVIEFNPNRPRNRVRYSICHELAHTLFPDCGERVRNRMTHESMRGDDWQLETLCNIGAAELLMPIGTVPKLATEHLTIDAVLESRKQHEVSAEAVLLRAIRLTGDQCAVFAASRRQYPTGSSDQYFVDYAVSSRSWVAGAIHAGTGLPKETVLGECVAIGVKAKGHEDWGSSVGRVRVECVGVPPYPNHMFPRVVGIAKPQKQATSNIASITYVPGDATQPRAGGFRIVAQIVNDSAFTWGGGLSLVARKKWPDAQQAFTAWAEHDRRNLRLGNLHFASVETSLGLASLIAQHGYGPSPTPRIRYLQLQSCLDKLAQLATERKATVHIPKLGCGQAGGSWPIVRELVEESLCGRGVKVYVYELAGAVPQAHAQGTLEFTGG